jgi:RND family efflux transporter MFP subunit
VSPRTLRNLLTAVVIMVVGIAATGALIKMKNKPERKTPPPSIPVVAAFTVSPDLNPVTITSFGSVKAKRSITVVPQVSGEILTKSTSFEPGSFIVQGEVLLSIDDTDYVFAYETARSNVALAEFNLAMASEEATVSQREWDRIGGTSSDGTTAQPTALVMHEPQLKLAETGLAAAKAALAQAQVNLDRCQIVAPFDGRVLSADVDAGQYLRAGTAIGTIYATDIAEVTVSVSDEDIAWITVGYDGDGNGVPVEVSARFAGADHHWPGHAVRLGGAVDSRSRLVPVVVEIPDPYQRQGDRPALIEGMFVEVAFQTLPQAGSVVVPRSSLRPGDEVWVIGAKGELDIRQVTVVRAGVEQAVISGGLNPGERICTSNLQYVTQGMVVRVEGDPLPKGDPGPEPKAVPKDGDK